MRATSAEAGARRAGDVELGVFAVRANVDHAQPGLVIANPSRELDGGNVVFLALHDLREAHPRRRSRTGPASACRQSPRARRRRWPRSQARARARGDLLARLVIRSRDVGMGRAFDTSLQPFRPRERA